MLLTPRESSPEPTPRPEDYNAAMLSKETLETYRRMTPGERLVLALRMTEQTIPALFEGSPELVTRRFEMLARENDERNRNMLTAIARTKTRP